jgi:hypothetical protein
VEAPRVVLGVGVDGLPAAAVSHARRLRRSGKSAIDFVLKSKYIKIVEKNNLICPEKQKN